ncbi:unnamed protein product [Urochloa decumbens]|uniref:J domain-containing protein n=1 Tax=Urochloa decumbens TaxID=240449 RepID=A0ABC8WXU7_9POAL
MAESSKEEQARRAQALAEKCFLAGNVSAARHWMLSAARLAPALPGVAQAAAAYDVHAAAARGRPVDWYAVLGLPQPRSSSGGAGAVVLAHDDIKRQHRRLCLLVHPDKNPSAAADGAFKLVHAAWEALSARHPTSDDDTAAAAAAPTQPARRPPPRPPDPPPRRTPAPGAGGQQRRRPSYADVASAPQPQTAAAPPSLPRAAPRVPPQPSASRCPSCGALTPYGKRSLRCTVCHWRPKGRWWRADGEFFR